MFAFFLPAIRRGQNEQMRIFDCTFLIISFNILTLSYNRNLGALWSTSGILQLDLISQPESDVHCSFDTLLESVLFHLDRV